MMMLGNAFVSGLALGMFLAAWRERRKGFMVLQAICCVFNATIAIAAYLHKFGS